MPSGGSADGALASGSGGGGGGGGGGNLIVFMPAGGMCVPRRVEADGSAFGRRFWLRNVESFREKEETLTPAGKGLLAGGEHGGEGD